MSDSEVEGAITSDDATERLKDALAEQPRDAELQAQAAKAVGRINVLIAGNTGSGKSTLINAIFGFARAKAGTGKPETMTIEPYEVPGKPLTLWDTRGFEAGDGEAVAKVGEKLDELAGKQNPADHFHVAWLCINSGGSRIEPAHVKFLKQLALRKIPCVVVLTKSSSDSMLEVAKKEARPSAAVLELLALSQPTRGGGTIEAFGLEELVGETYRIAPAGVKQAFVASQQVDLALKKTEAESTIRKWSTRAGMTGVLPIADIPAVWFIQRQMRAELDQLFGTDPEHPAVKSFNNEAIVGSLSALSQLARDLILKVLPAAALKMTGVGTLAGMAAAGVSSGAATEALGRAYLKAIVTHLETGRPLFSQQMFASLIKVIEVAAAAHKQRKAVVA